ncbi:MAG: hypothetical protein JXK07_14700 [Spirochaetes bacterium]|nr:hypothetical protein [Spirochaetota bacterium]MBN2770243.1 hypothetical protein [Spirochaetota bacterium]
MVKNYFNKSIIVIYGQKITLPEILILSICSILFPLTIPLYSLYSELNWSVVQILIAYGLAFDIMSGCLVYNSSQHKEIKYKENHLSGYVKHALLHMQPLVVAAFLTEELLIYIGLYWLIMYIVFVSLFEPVSRVTKKIENTIIGIFITVNFVFMGLCFMLIKDTSLLLYGVLFYIILAPLSAVQFYLPLKSQRLFGTTIAVFACILNMMILKAPNGFQWFIPVLFVKLFIGYNSREKILVEA